MRGFCLSASALILTGCGSADNEPGPGGVTVSEARALDEAAEMIEQQRPPPELQRAAPRGKPPPQPGEPG